MNKGIKLRIYPNKKQKELLVKTFGCVRLIYNIGLSMRHDAYANGDKIGYVQTCAILPKLKQDEKYSFLKEVDAVALQQSLRDLDVAFSNFLYKRSKYPKYKSKHDHANSYRTINKDNGIRIEGKHVRLPKIGFVKIRQTIEMGHINHAVVEQSPSGKYYVVLNVDFEPSKLPNTDKVIGIDVGIKNFCTMSNGDKIQNPKYLEKYQNRLIKEQRRLSRMKEGSKNWEKQRIRVARIHEHIANKRNDFLQKLSTTLINENQVICVENLDINEMLKKHKISQSITSVSWSKFFLMLEYKSEWYGRNFVKIPTFYPSSQTCSECGYKNTLVKNLSVRTWKCPKCGTIHDRDANAAKNILNKGIEMLIGAA